jgi:threonine dehydrogenase-like Zn-dependent dehydrogenase
MKALTWHGKNDIRCESVPDPKIEHERDPIIKVTACAICGSDLHLFDGVMPSMEKGDVLGHETMGEVVEVGSENKKLKVGDRVVVPFTISCGECFFCRNGFFFRLRALQPQSQAGGKALGTFARRPIRILTHTRWLCGRPGGISPRSLR